MILPVVLYRCKTWCLILREERRLRVFEISVPRKVFGLRMGEVTGNCEQLHNVELCDTLDPTHIIRVIK
jgi:hypothetical protein